MLNELNRCDRCLEHFQLPGILFRHFFYLCSAWKVPLELIFEFVARDPASEFLFSILLKSIKSTENYFIVEIKIAMLKIH